MPWASLSCDWRKRRNREPAGTCVTPPTHAALRGRGVQHPAPILRRVQVAEIWPQGREPNRTHLSGMSQPTSNFSISLNSSLKLQFFCLLLLTLDTGTMPLLCLKGQTCRAVRARARQGGSQASGPFLCLDHGLRWGWGLDAPNTLAMNRARGAAPMKGLGDKERGGGDASWEPVQPAPANCTPHTA